MNPPPTFPPNESSSPRAGEAAPRAAGIEGTPRVQVEFRWGDALVDLVTLKVGQERAVLLKTQDRMHIDARAIDSVVVTTSDGDVVSLTFGAAAPVGAFTCVATETTSATRRPVFRAYDGALPHAFILAAAVQTCLISALLLHPTHLDDDAGGGLALQDLRRVLKAPEGAAPTVGRGVFVAMGRHAEDAERAAEVHQARGRPSATRSTRDRPPSLEQVLEAMSRAVNNGTQHGDLKDTIGDLAVSAASSPQLGAGLGGMLRPRQSTPTGAGSGEVGAGTILVKTTIRERIERLKKSADENAKQRKKVAKAPRQVSVGKPTTLEVPRGEVTLDPVVHDHIARTVGKFRNSVRYCYETWGLPTNPTTTGRLVLELTLLPDGSVTAPEATIESHLALVGECVEKQSRTWYLGDGLVDTPTRLSFPYLLQPSRLDDR